jgi:hypothetical protein
MASENKMRNIDNTFNWYIPLKSRLVKNHLPINNKIIYMSKYMNKLINDTLIDWYYSDCINRTTITEFIKRDIKFSYGYLYTDNFDEFLKTYYIKTRDTNVYNFSRIRRINDNNVNYISFSDYYYIKNDRWKNSKKRYVFIDGLNGDLLDKKDVENCLKDVQNKCTKKGLDNNYLFSCINLFSLHSSNGKLSLYSFFKHISPPLMEYKNSGSGSDRDRLKTSITISALFNKMISLDFIILNMEEFIDAISTADGLYSTYFDSLDPTKKNSTLLKSADYVNNKLIFDNNMGKLDFTNPNENIIYNFQYSPIPSAGGYLEFVKKELENDKQEKALLNVMKHSWFIHKSYIPQKGLYDPDFTTYINDLSEQLSKST